jgi:hypothetical protein
MLSALILFCLSCSRPYVKLAADFDETKRKPALLAHISLDAADLFKPAPSEDGKPDMNYIMDLPLQNLVNNQLPDLGAQLLNGMSRILQQRGLIIYTDAARARKLDRFQGRSDDSLMANLFGYWLSPQGSAKSLNSTGILTTRYRGRLASALDGEMEEEAFVFINGNIVHSGSFFLQRRLVVVVWAVAIGEDGELLMKAKGAGEAQVSIARPEESVENLKTAVAQAIAELEAMPTEALKQRRKRPDSPATEEAGQPRN